MKITEVEKNLVKKHIDEWNYGILQADLLEEEKNIMNNLVANNYFIIYENKSYLPTPRANYPLLNIKSKNSEKVVNLRKQKTKIYSFSEFNQWKDCNMAYKIQRVDKVQQKPSAYSYYGTLAHDVFEDFILNNTPLKESHKQFIKRLNRLKELGLYLPRDSKGGTAIQDNWESSLNDFFLRNSFNNKRTKSYRTEVEVFNEINNKYIVGFIDLLHYTRKENGIFYVNIYDFKTSSMKTGERQKEDLLDKSRQLLLYKYLLEKTYPNIKVENIGWDFMKYVKLVWKGKEIIYPRKDNYMLKMENRIVKHLGEHQRSYVHDCLEQYEIPREVEDILQVKNCIINYEYTDKEIQDIIDFVNSTAGDIENTLKVYNMTKDDKQLTTKDYDTDSFFCNNLCAFKNYCPKLKELGVTSLGKDVAQKTMLDILAKAKMRREK